jgi:hypothetical protein
MLMYLGSRLSQRKARLYLCAVARLSYSHLLNRDDRKALETAERFGDGLLTGQELETAAEAYRGRERNYYILREATVMRLLGSEVCDALVNQTSRVGSIIWAALLQKLELWSADQPTGKLVACHIIRDLFGNPIRPAAPELIADVQSNEAVWTMARVVYEGTGSVWHSMPELGEAVKTAGCTNVDLLEHCNSPGPHVRGCWVLDLLLGKH